MSKRPSDGLASTWLDALASLLFDRSRRISLLIVVAYVSAFVGLIASFVPPQFDPDSQLLVLGIALMGLSFVCLFIVSVSVLDLAGSN